MKASILPFQGSSNEPEVSVEIYVVTGKHSILKIPESFCKECNLFYQAAKQASEQVDAEVNIQVKSYWTRFLRPLIKGGYHAPIILVDGELYSQGYNVPDEERLAEEISDLVS